MSELVVTRRLAEKVALVTGVSRGIGAAVACRLAAEGAAVVGVYRQQEAAAAQVIADINQTGGQATAFAADLTSVSECLCAWEKAAAIYGEPNILVHCAGLAHYELLMDTEPQVWDELFAIHARAAYLLAQAALPAMIRQGWGRIIIISSIWGLVGAANEVAYSAAKAAQIGLARALAKEVAMAGVTVNVVAPGAVNTQMLDELSEEDIADFAEQVPMGRLGTVAEVAAAVAFLAAPESSYISGQVLSPNGALI